MSAKHTPGPWHVEQFAGKVNVWPSNGRKEDKSAIAYDCAMDDARLIAAAPDLLAALQLAQKIIGHPDDSASKFIADAIARATGEQA